MSADDCIGRTELEPMIDLVAELTSQLMALMAKYENLQKEVLKLRKETEDLRKQLANEQRQYRGIDWRKVEAAVEDLQSRGEA